jgi:hypothetical protein
MARFLRLGTLLAMLGVVAASTALASIPEPSPVSTVPCLVYCPTADLTYKVTVKDAGGNLISGASVEVRVSSGINTKICWCTAGGQAPSAGVKKTGVISFTSITDGSGVAKFTLGAGGCVNYSQATNRIVEVYANSIKIGEVCAVSSDAVDQNGRLPIDSGYAPTACEVGLSDFTYLAAAWLGGGSAAQKLCGDLNTLAGAGLGDLVIWAPHSIGAHSCTKL